MEFILDDGKEFIESIKSSYTPVDPVLGETTTTPSIFKPELVEVKGEEPNTWGLSVEEDKTVYITFSSDVSGYTSVLDTWIAMDSELLADVTRIKNVLKNTKGPVKALVNALRVPVSNAKKKRIFPDYNILRTTVAGAHTCYRKLLAEERECIAEERYLKKSVAFLTKLRNEWYMD